MLEKDKLMFEFMTYGYSGIMNALVKLGLNMPLVARTAAYDMKPKVRELLKPMLGENVPKSVQDVADTMIPFLNKTFGFEIETEFPEPNTIRCKMKNCINRTLAEQSIAQGGEGCLLCLGAFMASLTISVFEVAEIDQFHGKPNSDHCILEIKIQK
jgi:hypothetical protein